MVGRFVGIGDGKYKLNIMIFMESNTNGESFIKRFEGKESDWKEYLAFTPEMQSEYQKVYTEHPEYTHRQLMARIVIGRIVTMRGVGFDIANSVRLSEKQKIELIKACEDYYYRDRAFNNYERTLLYQVRDEYHIRNSGLYKLAEHNFLDSLKSFFNL